MQSKAVWSHSQLKKSCGKRNGGFPVGSTAEQGELSPWSPTGALLLHTLLFISIIPGPHETKSQHGSLRVQDGQPESTGLTQGFFP